MIKEKISLELAHEFALMAMRAGWEVKDFTDLVDDEKLLTDLLEVKRGEVKIARPDYFCLVDLDVDPELIETAVVEEHRKGGIVRLELSGDDLLVNGTKIDLLLTQKQKDGLSTNGDEVHKELLEKSILNMNLYNHLLKYPQLIPDSWEKDENGNARQIVFWGTTYRDIGEAEEGDEDYDPDYKGDLLVFALNSHGGKWDGLCIYLGDAFGPTYYAAILES